MSEVFWLGMSCYILGAVIGIAIAFFAFRNSSIKLLYRLRGDTIVKDGYIRDETDTMIKIGSALKSFKQHGILKRARQGTPEPDDAQWFEKSKLEIIRMGRGSK